MQTPKPVASRTGARAPAWAPARHPKARPRSGITIVLALIPILFAIAACGGPGSHRDPDSWAQPPRHPPPSPLRLRIEAPDTVPAAQPVPLRLVLENRGDRPVEVGLGGRPIAFDFVVVAPDGSRSWRRLEGVAVALILQLRTLAPGEAVEFTDSWDQQDTRGRRVGPGTYRVRGILPVEAGAWETDPHTITILP
jgi:hypothetical protein